MNRRIRKKKQKQLETAASELARAVEAAKREYLRLCAAEAVSRHYGQGA